MQNSGLQTFLIASGPADRLVGFTFLFWFTAAFFSLSMAQDTGLRIDKNSIHTGLNGAQILLFETEDDYARLRITNNLFNSSTNNRYWDIAGRIGPNTTGLEDRLNFFLNGVGDILSLRGTGRVGVRTISPEATLHVNGYTKLGESAPNIKMKKLTDTLPTSNTSVNVEHGLADRFKILGVQILLDAVDAGLMGPGQENLNFPTGSPIGDKASYWFAVDDTYVNVVNNSGSPSLVSGRPFTILITYEE